MCVFVCVCVFMVVFVRLCEKVEREERSQIGAWMEES